MGGSLAANLSATTQPLVTGGQGSPRSHISFLDLDTNKPDAAFHEQTTSYSDVPTMQLSSRQRRPLVSPIPSALSSEGKFLCRMTRPILGKYCDTKQIHYVDHQVRKPGILPIAYGRKVVERLESPTIYPKYEYPAHLPQCECHPARKPMMTLQTCGYLVWNGPRPRIE